MRKTCICVLALFMIAGTLALVYLEKNAAQAQQQPVTEQKKFVSKSKDFPQGTATPSTECGECHQAIYREYAFGFGSDVTYKPMAYKDPKKELLSLPGRVLTAGSAHSFAGTDPWPLHARTSRPGENPAMYATILSLLTFRIWNKTKSNDRKLGLKVKKRLGSPAPVAISLRTERYEDPTELKRHMKPSRNLRSRRQPCVHIAIPQASGWSLNKPKPFLNGVMIFISRAWVPSSARIATCLELFGSRLRMRMCQSERWRRHLWTGGHSPQRISSALSLVIVSEKESTSALNFHVINIGAGHSVPTGSNRRGMYLKADVVDGKGTVVAKQDWMFAPWYGDRPDDKAFLEEDKKRPDASRPAWLTRRDPTKPSFELVKSVF